MTKYTTKLPVVCKCGANCWLVLPDCLAYACTNCLTVVVATGRGPYEEGKNLVEWAKDIAEEKKEDDSPSNSG